MRLQEFYLVKLLRPKEFYLVKLLMPNRDQISRFIETPEGTEIFKDIFDERRINGMPPSISAALVEIIIARKIGETSLREIQNLIISLKEMDLLDRNFSIKGHNASLAKMSGWISLGLKQLSNNEDFYNYPDEDRPISTFNYRFIGNHGNYGDVYDYLLAMVNMDIASTASSY